MRGRAPGRLGRACAFVRLLRAASLRCAERMARVNVCGLFDLAPSRHRREATPGSIVDRLYFIVLAMDHCGGASHAVTECRHQFRRKWRNETNGRKCRDFSAARAPRDRRGTPRFFRLWQNEADFASGAHACRPIPRDARLRSARRSALADLRIKMPMSGKPDIGGVLLRTTGFGAAN